MSTSSSGLESEAQEADRSRATSAGAVWRALLACAQMSREGRLSGINSLILDADGRLRGRSERAPGALFVRAADNGEWQAAEFLAGEARALADLYLPSCVPVTESTHVIGHLGQSLDAHIATHRGDSYYITGPDNILHLHRMRAVCSAVLVGAGTVAADDPSLTVRHVAGPNPVRIVLDPQRRLSADRKVFTDQQAATWVVCSRSGARSGKCGDAKLLEVPANDGRLDLRLMLESLAEQGLRTVFVEGGGLTVSAFLEAKLLDRLQIAVARLVTGNGRPGLRLPAHESLASCLRPAGGAYRMGQDILFDCDLRATPAGASQPNPTGLDRIY